MKDEREYSSSSMNENGFFWLISSWVVNSGKKKKGMDVNSVNFY